MKLKEKIKNIKWLIENKDKIANVIERKNKNNDFSLGGVPTFQRDYVEKILKEKN